MQRKETPREPLVPVGPIVKRPQRPEATL
jgi:hypothetical protein